MTQTFILTERPSRWWEGASGLEANGGETMVRPSACAEMDRQLLFKVSQWHSESDTDFNRIHN
jgi:hypothetical protein